MNFKAHLGSFYQYCHDHLIGKKILPLSSPPPSSSTLPSGQGIQVTRHDKQSPYRADDSSSNDDPSPKPSTSSILTSDRVVEVASKKQNSKESKDCIDQKYIISICGDEPQLSSWYLSSSSSTSSTSSISDPSRVVKATRYEKQNPKVTIEICGGDEPRPRQDYSLDFSDMSSSFSSLASGQEKKVTRDKKHNLYGVGGGPSSHDDPSPKPSTSSISDPSRVVKATRYASGVIKHTHLVEAFCAELNLVDFIEIVKLKFLPVEHFKNDVRISISISDLERKLREYISEEIAKARKQGLLTDEKLLKITNDFDIAASKTNEQENKSKNPSP